jgi:hypothetical protein
VAIGVAAAIATIVDATADGVPVAADAVDVPVAARPPSI